MHINKKASILLVVLIGFAFLAVLSISLMIGTSTERKQLVMNIYGERARSAAEAALNAAFLEFTSMQNSAETKIFKWLRNTYDNKPDDLQLDVSSDINALYLGIKGKPVSISPVTVSMEVVNKYSKDEDAANIEKKGVIKFISKARCGSEKRQIEAGYDFKVSIVHLPMIDATSVKPAEMNNFVLYIRNGKKFLDNDNTMTPKFEVINDTPNVSTKPGSGMCFFGNEGGNCNALFTKENSILKYKNTEFKYFNPVQLAGTMNNEQLTKLTDISMNIDSIPYEKVGRWFISGSDFFKFYLKDGSASFEGINVVNSPISFSSSVNYSGYSMVIGKDTIAIKNSLIKKNASDLLYILNVSENIPTSPSGNDFREIRLYNNPIDAVIATLNGPVSLMTSSRKITVLGSILCDELKRVYKGNAINGKLIRDPAILFGLKGVKSLVKYSVSLSRAPSYFLIKRYYE